MVYTYDAEGNLVSRVEAGLGQTSQFVYDRLNRQVGIYNPTGLLQPNDEIGMAYDGTGSPVAYAMLVQGVFDVAYYYYDAANRLDEVLDVTGNTYLTTDEDGRTESIIFPKPSGSDGVKVDYDYTEGGKPKTLTSRSIRVRRLRGSTTTTRGSCMGVCWRLRRRRCASGR